MVEHTDIQDAVSPYGNLDVDALCNGYGTVKSLAYNLSGINARYDPRVFRQ